MSKVRIYVESAYIEDLIRVKRKDLVHKIKDVLRLKKGDSVYVFDGEGKEYLYCITAVSKKEVLLTKKKEERKGEFSCKKVVLAFPLLKEEKINFILQKGTELGVDEFFLFFCQRSLQKAPSSNKIERWHRIIMEATRQSGRLWMPSLNQILQFEEIIRKEAEEKIVFSIEGRSLKEEIKDKKEVLAVVGPEGDFSLQEKTELVKRGFKFWKLSTNILRSETAAIIGVGIIKYLSEVWE